MSDRKRERINKGTDKHYVADPLYTVQLFIPDFCTEFQDPKPISSREIHDGKKVYRQTNKLTSLLKRQKQYIPCILRILGV